MAVGYSLAGRVALITGAARGIGLETAKQLSQHGALVTMLDVDRGPVAAQRALLGTIGVLRTGHAKWARLHAYC